MEKLIGQTNSGTGRRRASRLPWLCLLILASLVGAPAAFAQDECLVFGAKTYVGGQGKPVTQSDHFNATILRGTFTLVVQNGDASGNRRVSSGEVRLNGVEVVRESDFNQQTTLISKTVTIQAGNTLDVTIKGGPGENSSQPPMLTVKIVRYIGEKDGPAITVGQPQPGQILGASPVTVTGTVTDESDISSLTVNGVATPVVGGAFSAQVALSPGPNSISIAARDCEGNTSSKSVAVIYDTLPPVLNTTSPANNSLTNVRTAQVTGTASDDGVISSLTINGQPAALNGGSFSASVALAEGANSINVVATDSTGKQSTATASATLDTVAPVVTLTLPAPGTKINADTIGVSGQASDANGVASVTVNNNTATLAGGQFQQVAALEVGDNTVVVTATDNAGNTGTATMLVIRTRVTPLNIQITSPTSQSLFKGESVTVTGTTDTAATEVNVNGVAASLSGGSFTATSVPIREGVNILTATASNPDGGIGSISVHVLRDSSEPTVRVDSPTEGAVLNSSVVTVTGMVNDVVSGTVNAEQVTVTVNGLPATISNRTFVVPDLLLVRGANIVTAVARDRAGNENRHQVRVEMRDAAGQQRIVMVGGNNQTGQIGSTLPEPLTVQLLDANGNALANRTVTFAVRRSDGVVKALPQEGQEIVVMSDADGRAGVQFQLGTRSGVGNNTVSVTAAGFTGEMMFCESATMGQPAQIHGSMMMGETLTGIAGKPLPMPFEVIVTDSGGNPVGNVPVTFKVEQGGGQIEGAASVVKNTNNDGKAVVLPTLGEQEGISNNVVSASFLPAGLPAGDPAAPTIYLKASGLVQGAVSDTRVSGVVLDNQNRPIPHAQAKIVGRDDLMAYTNDQGQFSIPNAPVGVITLIVDGGTTTRTERFPFLAFQMMTISGQDNTVGMPIFIPFLDSESAKVVGGNEDVVLTMKGVPGVAFTIFANSVTKPDGSKYVGPVSLTQVHADKVPMPPPNGTAPKLVWTLQPAGLHFSKPIQVQLPNTDGLLPGQVVEVFSFDHALEQFVSGGMARVSPDGSVIVSDPGFGIHVSGWGAPAPPPPPPTCMNGCEDGNPCTSGFCFRGACIQRPTNEGARCDDRSGCSVGFCRSGSCQSDTQQANGTSCDDNQRCTDSDRCQDGACKGQPKNGEDCCNGKPYDPATQCCEDDEVLQKNPIEDLKKCPNRVSNPNWVREYDGCSLPASPGFDKDNPAGGDDTHFARRVPSTSPNAGPCDYHDDCYQTCNVGAHVDFLGFPEGRSVCDNAMYSRMLAVCSNSQAGFIRRRVCFEFADIYYAGLRVGAALAYKGRQKQVCNCCQ